VPRCPLFLLTGLLEEVVERVSGKEVVSGPLRESCSDGEGIAVFLLELLYFPLTGLLEGVEGVLGKVAVPGPSERSCSDGGWIEVEVTSRG